MPATERNPELDPALAELVANDLIDEVEARADQEWIRALASKVVANELSLDQAAEAMEARAKVAARRALTRGKAP